MIKLPLKYRKKEKVYNNEGIQIVDTSEKEAPVYSDRKYDYYLIYD